MCNGRFHCSELLRIAFSVAQDFRCTARRPRGGWGRRVTTHAGAVLRDPRVGDARESPGQLTRRRAGPDLRREGEAAGTGPADVSRPGHILESGVPAR